MANHSGPVVAERGHLTVIRCRECGFAHLRTQPDSQSLHNFYESSFWQVEKVGALARFHEQRPRLDAIHGDWLSVAETVTLGRNILDVGCGYGFYLAEAQRRGWSEWGVDLSMESIKFARELIGSVARITQCSWPDTPTQYNCISALWLLEHLPDPTEFSRWCRAHLSGGGVLVLAVPQEWTDMQRRANQYASVHDWFVHYTHLSYFDRASLYGLLGRCGFRVVDELATFPMEECIVYGRDYTRNEALGAHLYNAIRIAELQATREERLNDYRARAHNNSGRDLTVFAVPEYVDVK